MEQWKNKLKADPTEWLLEDTDPSVRYFTLKDIQGRPEDDRAVQDARQSIMQKGMVPDILFKQRDPAYLKNYPGFYTRKYDGLVWTLILMSELGATVNDQIREQCEYLLAHSQETGDGGFSMHEAVKTGGGRLSEVVPCLTGNMVWSLIRMGFFDNPGVQRGLNWLTRFMRFNDGEELEPQVPPYDRNETCWGRHTCHMGAVKALKAFGAVPKDKWTAEINDTVQRAVEFILIHRIYKRSHDVNRVSKPGWLKFGFPLMYQTDALEILDILTALHIKDSRMEDAVRVVIEKQDGAGRWKLENTYSSDRLLIPFGQLNEPSKWITLRAMRVLKRYESN